VRASHAEHQRFVVLPEFVQHVLRRDIVRIVVGNALDACNMADRSQRSTADFTHSFGNVVGHAKELIALLIE
jgi:hypothetical protein